MKAPELDYAFLCGYATIHSNSLTVVDASFTRSLFEQLPATFSFSIAGRVRLDEKSEGATISIKISVPDESIEATVSTQLLPDGADVYDGKVGVLFATQVQMPIPVLGLYSVEISLDGKVVRLLKFAAAQIDSE